MGWGMKTRQQSTTRNHFALFKPAFNFKRPKTDSSKNNCTWHLMIMLLRGHYTYSIFIFYIYLCETKTSNIHIRAETETMNTSFYMVPISWQHFLFYITNKQIWNLSRAAEEQRDAWSWGRNTSLHQHWLHWPVCRFNVLPSQNYDG